MPNKGVKLVIKREFLSGKQGSKANFRGFHALVGESETYERYLWRTVPSCVGQLSHSACRFAHSNVSNQNTKLSIISTNFEHLARTI